MSKFNFELNCHNFANFELELLRSVQPDANLNTELRFSVQISEFNSKRRSNVERGKSTFRVRDAVPNTNSRFERELGGVGIGWGVAMYTWGPAAPSPGRRDAAVTSWMRRRHRRPLMLLLLLARRCVESCRDRGGGV